MYILFYSLSASIDFTMKQTLLLALVLFICGTPARAQQAPTKDQWEHPQFGRLPRVSMPVQNNATLQAEEYSLREMGRAPQFAKAIEVNYTPDNSGRWEEIAAGQSRWRLGVRSQGAYSLNFGFTGFYLPSEAEFFLINSRTAEKMGPFRSADNEDHAEFWSPIIESEEVILEVVLPTRQKTDLRLQLGFVNHDFVNLTQVRSSECHIDIICGQNNGYPQVENFRNVAQSVGLISIRGTSICTGFLVNNGKEDCHPYFVTARHCQSRASDAPSLVVYWNFQNSICRQPGSTANASPGDGKFDTFNTGMVQRSSNSNSDFTLLELDDPVVLDANAYFAGWNTTNQTPTGGVATVHQAGSEEKRFSYSTRSTYLGNWGAATQVSNGNHVIVPRWDIGSTEDGSSGAPLFNQQGQVIGQLHGGTALCGNTGYDSFGTWKASWDAGASLNTRLRDWLDPNRNALEQMGGRWHYECLNSILLDQENRSICGLGTASWNIQLNNPNAQSIQFSILNLPAGLKAQFSKNPITGTSNTLELRNESSTLSGFQTLKLQAIVGSDTLSRFLLVEIVQAPQPVQALEPQNGDNLVPLPVQLRWRKGKFAQQYSIVLARDAAFRDIIGRYRSLDTTYQIGQLDLKGTYYWKVWGINTCDTSLVPNTFQQFSIAPSIQATVLPEFQALCQADSMVLLLKAADGYQGSATLSYRVTPRTALSLSFSEDPAKINAGVLFQAKARNLRPLLPGNYELTFYTRQNNLRDSTKVSFSITAAPRIPVLSTPAVSAVLLDKRPNFSWSSSGAVERYELEVASDSAFLFPLWTANLELTEYQRAQDLAAGRYFWRVRALNSCGITESKIQSFTVFQSNLSKINNLDVGIEPIPSTGRVTLHLSAAIDGASIELYNMSGQLLSTIVPGQVFRDWTIDLSRYPAGMYVLRLKHRQSSVGLRVILQR